MTNTAIIYVLIYKKACELSSWFSLSQFVVHNRFSVDRAKWKPRGFFSFTMLYFKTIIRVIVLPYTFCEVNVARKSIFRVGVYETL